MEKVTVHEVWACNLEEEIGLIELCLQEFPMISMDTEFPGTVFGRDKRHLSPPEYYDLMKLNVDALSLIQLGLTLSDGAGKLPTFDGSRHVWQFNFADFDSETQPHNPDSISLLRRQGIDFSKNRDMGIDSRHFAYLFQLSGLFRRRDLVWITFHGSHDFAFLIKILTNSPLPDCVGGFMALMHHYFGEVVFDLKPLAGAWGFRGGLEKIAAWLKVERKVGQSHQAGSDSLLTMEVLIRLIKTEAHSSLNFFNYNLFGLT